MQYLDDEGLKAHAEEKKLQKHYLKDIRLKGALFGW